MVSTSRSSVRVLMIIPSFMKRGIEDAVRSDRHPRMDYYELERELVSRGAAISWLDYSSFSGPDIGFKDVRLALLGLLRKQHFDAIFCNSESIALPLGVMLARTKSANRPKVVTIGHRISTAKKQVFFTKFGAQDSIDCIFLYARAQQVHAIEALGLSPNKVPLIAFHADSNFFRPIEEIVGKRQARPLICSAGLEWRDYPTLLKVAERMPGTDFHIAAASPWSKHKDETAALTLPQNVTVRKHDYQSLRNLYLNSTLTAVPLYETDFQAGVTTILESMACGIPVVTSRTVGQADVIIDGQNGFYTSPGDSDELHAKLMDLLANPEVLTDISVKCGEWVRSNASIERWAEQIASAILAC